MSGNCAGEDAASRQQCPQCGRGTARQLPVERGASSSDLGRLVLAPRGRGRITEGRPHITVTLWAGRKCVLLLHTPRNKTVLWPFSLSCVCTHIPATHSRVRTHSPLGFDAGGLIKMFTRVEGFSEAFALFVLGCNCYPREEGEGKEGMPAGGGCPSSAEPGAYASWGRGSGAECQRERHKDRAGDSLPENQAVAQKRVT